MTNIPLSVVRQMMLVFRSASWLLAFPIISEVLSLALCGHKLNSVCVVISLKPSQQVRVLFWLFVWFFFFVIVVKMTCHHYQSLLFYKVFIVIGSVGHVTLKK